MTDKLLIKRELLERLVDPSRRVPQAIHLHNSDCMELRKVLAAPSQPEGDAPTVVAVVLTEEQMGIGYDRRMGPVVWIGTPPAGEQLMTVSQHERAIAELREECEHWKAGANAEAARADELKAERDTLRQQLAERDAAIEEWSGTAVQNGMECDSLRQQLAEAQSNTDKWCDVACAQRDEADRVAAQRDKLAGLLREVNDTMKSYFPGENPPAHSRLVERIDAALAEVNK